MVEGAGVEKRENTHVHPAYRGNSMGSPAQIQLGCARSVSAE